MNMKIREELPSDVAAIHALNVAAFGQPGEAALVDALRAAGAVSLSLVAVDAAEAVVGHILFSPVMIHDAESGVQIGVDALGLAPMAVVPDRQRSGVGSAMVHAGLDELRGRGSDAVVVLGHPEYYPRFGFVPASRFGIRWNHHAPDEAFMALELRERALIECAGVVSYRREFEDL